MNNGEFLGRLYKSQALEEYQNHLEKKKNELIQKIEDMDEECIKKEGKIRKLKGKAAYYKIFLDAAWAINAFAQLFSLLMGTKNQTLKGDGTVECLKATSDFMWRGTHFRHSHYKYRMHDLGKNVETIKVNLKKKEEKLTSVDSIKKKFDSYQNEPEKQEVQLHSNIQDRWKYKLEKFRSRLLVYKESRTHTRPFVNRIRRWLGLMDHSKKCKIAGDVIDRINEATEQLEKFDDFSTVEENKGLLNQRRVVFEGLKATVENACKEDSKLTSRWSAGTGELTEILNGMKKNEKKCLFGFCRRSIVYDNRFLKIRFDEQEDERSPGLEREALQGGGDERVIVGSTMMGTRLSV